jgi:replicative DNA helicase
MYEKRLLSKVLFEKQFHVLRMNGVDVHDFEEFADVYTFIRDYVKEHNTTPDYRTVVEEFDEFEYEPEVQDTFKFLCSKLKARTAKRLAFELLQGQAKENFKTMSGDKFTEWLAEETKKIREITSTKVMTGTNFAINGEERKALNNEAKNPDTKQYIPTPYEQLTKWLGGGFEIGDFILLLAFTNVGKSWLATDMGLCAWRNNFGVLHYSPELSKRQQLFRNDTLNGHFDNQAIRRGALESREEKRFFEYLNEFTPEKECEKYIIKTMEDLPDGLSIDVIEHDLQMNPDIRLVIIDGFNLMVHEKADGTRNKMTATSRKLRQVFGRYNVTGIVVHQTSAQSQKEKAKEDEDGLRIISPPSF